MRFQIGVEIEQTRYTTIIVETEAETLEEAEHKCINSVHEVCSKVVHKEDLGISYFHEWEDGALFCNGVDHEVDWNSGDYKSDLKV